MCTTLVYNPSIQFMPARVPIFVCLSLLIGAGSACREEAEVPLEQIPSVSQPSPELAPQEVVHAVMDALQRNDQPNPDAGIAIAYTFASPTTREAAGTFDAFATLVKSQPFATMLGHKSVDYGPLRVEGDRAEQRLRVTAADGRSVGFSFVLSKQSEGPYSGCWMTDGVMPFRPGVRPPVQQRGTPRPAPQPPRQPVGPAAPIV